MDTGARAGGHGPCQPGRVDGAQAAGAWLMLRIEDNCVRQALDLIAECCKQRWLGIGLDVRRWVLPQKVACRGTFIDGDADDGQLRRAGRLRIENGQLLHAGQAVAGPKVQHHGLPRELRQAQAASAVEAGQVELRRRGERMAGQQGQPR